MVGLLAACLGGAALLFGAPAESQDRGDLPEEAMVKRTDHMVGSHADPGGGSDTATKSSGGTIIGVPGAPSARIVIDGGQLPAPPQKFGGKIGPTAKDSKPYWPARIVPPKGAPNVLLIITDDSGYGVPGTFGGVIPTPALDRIANNGLRYTNFHSTALCSPTRAALITGRNHHSVGFGVPST
ncbi:MAG TPA: sulfatase-like hydrolase/transferase, partial [Burkholderiales bacterium]